VKDVLLWHLSVPFSTGVNIRNLHNIIFASPSKSRIRNLQSIGRGLRLGDNKEEATLFDISDDFRIGKYTNYSLHHFVERVKIYDDEKFNYKFYNINLKND
jgi:superfamily II DNA or RNA helicase